MVSFSGAEPLLAAFMGSGGTLMTTNHPPGPTYFGRTYFCVPPILALPRGVEISNCWGDVRAGEGVPFPEELDGVVVETRDAGRKG